MSLRQWYRDTTRKVFNYIGDRASPNWYSKQAKSAEADLGEARRRLYDTLVRDSYIDDLVRAHEANRISNSYGERIAEALRGKL